MKKHDGNTVDIRMLAESHSRLFLHKKTEYPLFFIFDISQSTFKDFLQRNRMSIKSQKL